MKRIAIGFALLTVSTFAAGLTTAEAADGAPEDCPPRGECCPLVRGNYIETNAAAWFVCFFEAVTRPGG